MVSSFRNRVEDNLVDEESPVADLVALRIKREASKKLLAAMETELEGLRVTVDAKSDYAELLEDRLAQQKILFEKTEEAVETWIAETEA